MTPLVLDRLVLSSFRNLRSFEISPGRRLTVVSGDNGHGKTSLLEAIYFLATSRSFRTPRLADVVLHGESSAWVRGTFLEGGPHALPREQVAAVTEGKRALKVDGKRPPSLVDYAVRSPIVCFHAGELELSSGPASARRTLLDRIALFVTPTSVDDGIRYRQAMRARQRALEARGSGGADVGPFEVLAARHGARLTRARREAALTLEEHLGEVFPRLGAPGLSLDARYVPGGTDDPPLAEAELRARRDRDRARGVAGFGPHRDDLALSLSGHPARVVASQGQHRALTLALKLAELHSIAGARGLFPILLLDDVSSELDRERTRALLGYLAGTAGQILLTTTRPELIETPDLHPSDRADLTLREGALSS